METLTGNMFPNIGTDEVENDDEIKKRWQFAIMLSRRALLVDPKARVGTGVVLSGNLLACIQVRMAAEYTSFGKVCAMIFWIVSFLLSLSFCAFLIYEVFEKYSNSPVIVTLQSSEQSLDSVPFPAVTLCNMNKFSKSKVAEFELISNSPHHPKFLKAKQYLQFIKIACNAHRSFAKVFGFAYKRNTVLHHEIGYVPQEKQQRMIDFLIEETIPCDRLIRLCILGGKAYTNCSKLFKPIITNYGKCCVFNVLPLPLLFRNPQAKNTTKSSYFDNPVLGSHGEKYWPESELAEWSKWDFNQGFVLPENLSRPWTQRRAGKPYGLSILLDPDVKEYACPVSDSVGLRYILHSPLEIPHVTEFASAVELNKEMFIEVHPELTKADEEIRDISQKKRRCYFGRERQLSLFRSYTDGNCMDECFADILAEFCGCTFFYMPRAAGVRICNNDPQNTDHACVEKAKKDLWKTLNEKCGHCDSLCEDITYKHETTVAEMQERSKLWLDPDPQLYPENITWGNHEMAILHIFYGADKTVPKLRKRLYGITDLIASSGGVLGLCLGFSLLTGVEIVYYLICRPFWKHRAAKKISQGEVARIARTLTHKSNINPVISVNPKTVPLYMDNWKGGLRQNIQHLYLP